jgi:alpha-tubulin suppressor-like RCC1 family protein
VSHAIGVATGGLHACALLDNGSVSCWGDDAHGQLGRGNTARGAHDPAGVMELPPTRQLALGDVHSCAMTEDDRLFCWGRDPLRGNGPDAPLPIEVPL